MWFDQAPGFVAVPPAISEAHLLVVAAGEREHRERVGVDRRSAAVPAQRRHVGMHSVDATSQPVGQHLLELRERAHRRFLDAFDRRAGGGAEADRDRHCFVVVEQQGREVRAGRQPVAAGNPRRGVDRVAELAEPLDVSPQRTGADLEVVGQLRPGPELVGLEQREQAQRPARRIVHVRDLSSYCGQLLTAVHRSVLSHRGR